MYYSSRIELGSMLAERHEFLHGTDSIIVSLQQKTLSVCISMATQLRAWVFPLLTERIYLPGDPRVLGVVNQDGDFCWNPQFSVYEQQEFVAEFYGLIEDKKRQAFSLINRQLSDYGQLNKMAMQGRNVVIVGDIVKDSVEIAATRELLKEVKSNKLFAAGGNVDVVAADQLRLLADDVYFLDVMSNLFNEEHYFEQPDSYTEEENKKLVTNIATYWI